MKLLKRLWWDILWWWKFRIKGSVNPDTLIAPPTAVKQTKRNAAADARIVSQWMQEVDGEYDFAGIAQRIDEPWDQNGGYANLELMEILPSVKDEVRLDFTYESRQYETAATLQEQLFQRSFGH